MTAPDETTDTRSAEDKRAERVQAREDALDAQRARDAEVIARTTPTPVTALDALGVERIITTTSDYTPPQTDPDPKEVARLANLQTRLDNQKRERLDKLTATPSGETGATVAREALAAETGVGTPAQEPASSTTTTTWPGSTPAAATTEEA